MGVVSCEACRAALTHFCATAGRAAAMIYMFGGASSDGHMNDLWMLQGDSVAGACGQ